MYNIIFTINWKQIWILKISLEVEYERLYQRNEPENLKNFIIIYVPDNITTMYPQKIFDSILDKHGKIFVPYTAKCEYQLDVRTSDEEKPWV